MRRFGSGRSHRILSGCVASLALFRTAAAQSYREDVSVGLIRVDLTATDASGKPLQDLAPSDLKLRVDGQEVPIVSLDPVGSDRASLPVPVPPAGSSSPPSGRETPAVPEAQPASALSIVVLVDQTSMDSFSRIIVLDQLKKFFARPLADGVEISIERFDGRLHVECPWTRDAVEARAAVDRVFRRSVPQDVPNAALLASDPVDEAYHSKRQALLVDADVQAVGYFSRRSLDGLLQALALFPDTAGGRRELVWATNGTSLLSPLALALAAEAARGGSSSPRQVSGRPDLPDAQIPAAPSHPKARGTDPLGVRTRIDAIVAKANQKEIAILPVDAQPLDDGLFLGDRSRDGDVTSPMITTFGLRSDVAQAMTRMGRDTGGEATLLAGKLGGTLRRAVSSRSSGYILTFRDPDAGDNHAHAIDISSRRPGVRLSYRRAFQTLDPVARMSDRVISNLHVSRPANPLGASVRAASAVRDGDAVLVGLVVSFPPLPAAGETAAGDREIDVVGACLDRRGNATEPFGKSGTARPVSAANGTRLEETLVVRLRPGPHLWSLAIRDRRSGITSYLRFRTNLRAGDSS